MVAGHLTSLAELKVQISDLMVVTKTRCSHVQHFLVRQKLEFHFSAPVAGSGVNMVDITAMAANISVKLEHCQLPLQRLKIP